MNRPEIMDLLSQVTEIGSLPQTLAAVLKVLNNPNSGADEIADVISKDVSLTSRVLRMVNSAQFGRRRRVTRVSEAVILMGINSIKVLTLSSSVFSMVADKELFQKFNIKRIWRHLIETASSARSIASEIKYRGQEEAFVAGILHDIGIIVMVIYFNEKYLEVLDKMRTGKKGLSLTEREVFGFAHEEVGGQLIENWKLPSNLSFVVGNHHNYENSSLVPEEEVLNHIIALADRLSMGPFDDCYPDVEENIIAIQTLGRQLNLDSATINRIRKESVIESIKLAEYLELDIGDILEILTEANDKLAELYFSLEKLFLEKQELQAIVNAAATETREPAI
jgi:putative nucleotidyltransferase with HDIG domain